MLRVRFHGRGGQGVKTSSRILGRAAFLAGYFAQDSPIYGAERRGAPVAAFTRISHGPILERGYIFHPHIVVVMDETLIEDRQARPLEGLQRGGVAFINTAASEASESSRDGYTVLRYSLTDEALKTIGRPVISAPAAATAAKISGLIRKRHVLEAASEELAELGLGGEMLEKNLKLVSEVFEKIPRHPVSFDEEYRRPVVLASLSSEAVVSGDITRTGNSYLRRTGNWRVFRPVVDYSKCTGCMVCFVYCPDSAIVLDAEGRPVVDYENCKGCLICLKECPLKAISAVKEVRAYA
ncbi:MAG: 2-oxoacid:acceptor oxidoreductase family protein [Candidatus Caldarchaeum sp.]